jgi:hypothetical protein
MKCGLEMNRLATLWFFLADLRQPNALRIPHKMKNDYEEGFQQNRKEKK